MRGRRVDCGRLRGRVTKGGGIGEESEKKARQADEVVESGKSNSMTGAPRDRE